MELNIFIADMKTNITYMHANVKYKFFMHSYMKKYRINASFAELQFAEMIWVLPATYSRLSHFLSRGEVDIIV